jgi:DNA-binding GntR family transcriptional regulator
LANDIHHGDVYQLILDAIDGGELPGGSRLIETELAERFGVSRTPVREALKRLEAQGVVAADGRRLKVAELDHDQLGELYEVRRVVEGLAARLAARHAAPEEIVLLRQMADEDRALADDARALSLANKRFHRQLHRASHNRYLNQLLQGMRRSLALLAATTMVSATRRREAIAEHEAMIRAIADRDEDSAEAAARQHISNAYSARLRILAEK